MLKHKYPPSLLGEQLYFFGGGGNQDVTSRVEPWEDAKHYYNNIYAAGWTAYEAESKAPYDGRFLAGANTYDLLARNFTDSALTDMESDVDKIRDHAIRLAGGEFLDPESNPFLVGSVNSAIELARRQLTEQVLPAILDTAIQSGAYGGTAQEVLVATALENFDRESAKISNAIYYENFRRERELQERFPGILTTAEEIQIKMPTLAQVSADQLRGLSQIELDELWKHFLDTNEALWRGLQEFLAVLTGGGFNQSSTHDPSKTNNKFANLFQGALGGAVTGFEVGGPVGGAIGGLIGGIGGILS